MSRTARFGIALVLAPVVGLAAAASDETAAAPLTWKELPPLPDRVGFAGPFAGVSGGALLVAGGANFPDRPPWQGGTKVWTDRVFVLEKPEGPWKELAEKLPRPLGYGVSLSTAEGVLCVGGSDAARHHADVFLLRYAAGRLTCAELPPLPRPCANACGALHGQVAYVAGGLASPDATATLHTFWKLDLARPPGERRWEELEPWPGRPRMLGVAAVRDGAFLLLSGTDLHAGPDGKAVRTYLRDAYRYHPSAGWRRIADLPAATVAAPSPAAVVAGRILVFGGDDGAHVGFDPPDRHPGFPATVRAYHAGADVWETAGDTPAPFVTTPLVPWRGGFVTPGGERRPGVRTTRVALATPRPGETAFGALDLLLVAACPAVLLAFAAYAARRRA